MITDQERVAASALDVHGMKSLPVDVLKIARSERIELCPTKARSDFSGRLEYVRELKRFLLFYPDIPNAASNPRIRFSIGHELGHYFLQRHHERLVSGGESHNSQSGFICDKEMEQEADCFASGLLIPEQALKQRLVPRGFLTLDQIVKLASDCQSSRESSAIRYVRYATEICVAVVSRNGTVLYGVSSDDAERVRLFVKRSSQVPPSSSAVRAATQSDIVQGELPGSAWCSWSPIKTLTEESVALGYNNLVLTLLAYSKP